MLGRMTIGNILYLSCLLSDKAWAQETHTMGPIEVFNLISESTQTMACPEERHAEVKSALTDMEAADKADRLDQHPDMTNRDTQRRIRVSEFAAEGCLKDAEDYLSAALIYQHGTLLDHFYLALYYAKRATALDHPFGIELQKVALDRFLMRHGYAQIFGTQIASPLAYRLFQGREDDEIPCLWPLADMTEANDLLEESLIKQATDAQHVMLASGLKPCDFPAKPLDAHAAALAKPLPRSIGRP